MTGREVGGVDVSTALMLVAAAVGLVIVLAVLLAVFRNLLYICRPNEILMFAGRKHTLPDGV